jgi:hypothetical protein
MTALLETMQFPHWLMIAGALLVVLGFIGLAFHRSMNGPDNGSDQSANLHSASAAAMPHPPTERLKAMRESASASADSQRMAKGK